MKSQQPNAQELAKQTLAQKIPLTIQSQQLWTSFDTTKTYLLSTKSDVRSPCSSKNSIQVNKQVQINGDSPVRYSTEILNGKKKRVLKKSIDVEDNISTQQHGVSKDKQLYTPSLNKLNGYCQLPRQRIASKCEKDNQKLLQIHLEQGKALKVKTYNDQNFLIDSSLKSKNSTQIDNITNQISCRDLSNCDTRNKPTFLCQTLNGDEIQKLRQKGTTQVIKAFREYIDEALDVQNRKNDPVLLQKYSKPKINKALQIKDQVQNNKPGSVINGKNLPKPPSGLQIRRYNLDEKRNTISDLDVSKTAAKISRSDLRLMHESLNNDLTVENKNQLLRATSSYSRNKSGLTTGMKTRLKSACVSSSLNNRCEAEYADYKFFDSHANKTTPKYTQISRNHNVQHFFSDKQFELKTEVPDIEGAGGAGVPQSLAQKSRDSGFNSSQKRLGTSQSSQVSLKSGKSGDNTRGKKSNAKSVPQRTVIVTEDPEAEHDPNDDFTWAVNRGGLQTKSKPIIEFKQTLREKVPVGFQKKHLKKNVMKKSSGKNLFDVTINTNQAQYKNDLHWLKISSPDYFKARANMRIHELAVFTQRRVNKRLLEKEAAPEACKMIERVNTLKEQGDSLKQSDVQFIQQVLKKGAINNRQTQDDFYEAQ